MSTILDRASTAKVRCALQACMMASLIRRVAAGARATRSSKRADLLPLELLLTEAQRLAINTSNFPSSRCDCANNQCILLCRVGLGKAK